MSDEKLFDAALTDKPRAAQKHLGSSSENIHAAAVVGDARAVEQFLRRDRSLAKRKGGPRNWPPLLYVSFSRIHWALPARRAAMARIAKRLLRAGADPDTFWIHPDWPDSPQSALYGACGETDNPAVARVLLEAGADPDDGESVYHAAQKNFRRCLELLLRHGADLTGPFKPWNNTPLYFLMGMAPGPGEAASIAGIRWLLEHGADPNVVSYENRETPLHQAARHGRRPELIRLLLRHGADPRLRAKDGLTALALAVRHGHAAVATVLRRAAPDVPLTPADLFAGACSRGDLASVRAALRKDPRLARTAHLASIAARGSAPVVRTLLAAGASPRSRGDAGGTALHLAAWFGNAPVAAALIRAGAPLEDRRNHFHGTPLGWALHGSLYCPARARGDYPSVVRRLLHAGAKVGKDQSGSEAVNRVLARKR